MPYAANEGVDHTVLSDQDLHYAQIDQQSRLKTTAAQADLSPLFTYGVRIYLS